MIREHGFEEIRGLPGPLPAGETILWQGAPNWAGFARRAFHLRWIAAYFAILAIWRFLALRADGEGTQVAIEGASWIVVIGAGPALILGLFAWLVQKTTVYTVTDRRVVLRVGVALPTTINLPYKVVGSAAVKLYPDGTGDILLKLVAPHHVFWMFLWPHARPWHLRVPEPMLRSIPDAATVANLLARSLAASAMMPVPALPEAEQMTTTAGRPAVA